VQPPFRSRILKWTITSGLFVVGLAGFVLLAVIPIGGSFLITNARFSRDREPADVPFGVEDVAFRSSDGVQLVGWWNSGSTDARAAVVLVHGLNRSRLEMLDRRSAMAALGFATLVFDLRNHGQSDPDFTTLGVRESRDVCAAARFARSKREGLPVVLWGVSLGAAASLLGAECSGAAAIVSDSAFLSVENTVRHHYSAIFRLPSFPTADLILFVTRFRMGFSLADGDVEARVRSLESPVLFIAGGQDWRMPPEIARRLLAASPNPQSRLFVVESATHGHAWEEEPEAYLEQVLGFLGEVLPAPDSEVATPTLY